jgi:glycosyltransferase involved in cell wall biosynthesis
LDSALRQLASKVRFDIVQAASWLATGYFSTKKPVAPVVVRVSSYEPLLVPARVQELTFDERMTCNIELAAMRNASAVYAPSRFLAKEIAQKTGLNVQVVKPPFYHPKNSAVDTFVVKKLDDWPRYMLYFGRLSRCKGAALLANAVEALAQRLSGFHLAIAGPIDGNDASGKHLLRLTQIYPHLVRYIGEIRPCQLIPVVRKAHAVVLPSLMDNLPNTCIEAMGFGKLVIGPNGVSFDEMISDGESGILFQLGDVFSLCEAIVRAWQMPEGERRRMGEAAKTQIGRMRPEIALDNLEKLYESVIAQC